MDKKLLKLNTISSLIYQVVSILCGFVLPALILNAYGSETNGLVNSIAQFLALITYLDFGVSAVVQSALYKPLAENDENETSKIITSAQKFFRRIAKILIGYVILLSIAYPFLIKQNFDPLYVITLICAISINSFARYYFGITDMLLICADQRIYIKFITETLTVLFNTLACALLILGGFSIQVVKFTTAGIFLIRPFVYRLYVRKHYKIDRHADYEEEPIKQKWNGIAQHVAAVILNGTDIVILTLFSTLENVSIYSIYFLVINSVQTLFISATSGLQSYWGNLWAKEENEKLTFSFDTISWIIHNSVVFVFGCTAILIVPFVQIYTKFQVDVNYNVPVFALLITLAYAVYCLRLPYNIIILSCNFYKQTQKCYIFSTILNVLISIIMVKNFGLIGVAIGTLIAMIYQTIWMAWFNSKYMLKYPFKHFIKQIIIDILIFIVCFFVSKTFHLKSLEFSSWFIMAIQIGLIWLTFILIFNFVFYRQKMISSIRLLCDKMKFHTSHKK